MSTTLLGAPSLVCARSDARYELAAPDRARLALARGWLWLGIAALIGSGLLSLLLVLSRTPGLNRLLPVADLFHVALVVHVDLSVLVWFLAMGGLLWTLSGSGRGLAWGWAGLALCGLGAAAMTVSPFLGGEAVMANYVPVIESPAFLAGLVVFAAGALLLVLRAMATAPRIGPQYDGGGALRFGLSAAAVATAVSLLAFGWSWAVLPASLTGKAYWELLFWGGGHGLQFTWTLLMLVGWLWLASASGARVPLSPRLAVLMFALALAAVFVTPYAYLAHDITSVEHRHALTWAMRAGGGLAIVPVALAAVAAVLTARPATSETAPLRAALLASVLLFGAGGVIGMLINGSNVRIPAHYHGCIVGVTLALMGLVYRLLPAFGYAAPRGRLAAAQPWVYAIGQLMHILGLVWAGGYGVQRKVAGSEQVLRTPSEIAGMGLMGAGGLLAIVGGLLFVLVVLRAMRGAGAARR